MALKRFAFRTEYEGTAYCGFQLQPDQPTIQEAIEKAFLALYQLDIRIVGSGRTDSGVHAAGQIFHADLPDKIPCHKLGMALNSYLPEDIRIIGVSRVDDTFHARFDAVSRRYTYRIFNGITVLKRRFAWQIYQSLDVSAMKQCLPVISGEHDFTSFCLSQTETENKKCDIQTAGWHVIGSELFFTVQANRFLHSMVRSLAGTMVEVGKGRYTVEDFENILKKHNHGSGAVTAPARGLVLEEVIYNPQITWQWSGVS
ncbi:MAG: tRNA pseudouridine(38-40) synthase TruA [Candidatus Neomarinimicrobiota bacterium]|nr:tRNA pseudouridine(38-40) synthase TruA [Candidatus Neomarinimicrobiota bacterium]RKY49232.1 MAG: tRNA pseudouridine(38-40) synthase TruA [Candidatus Neomarinimicrobiota bacterium]